MLWGSCCFFLGGGGGEGLYSAHCAAGVCIVGLGGEEGDVVMLRMSVVLFVKIQNTQEIDMKLFEAV